MNGTQTAGDNVDALAADLAIIRSHYADFNARRLDAAAARFHADARIEQVTGQVASGPDGFLLLARQWLSAFPDAHLTIEAIRPVGAGLYDADLVAEATHTGTLTFASWEFRASHVHVRIPAREFFQIENGQFRLTSVSFDLHDLVRQLAAVDTTKLLQHIARLHQLGERLALEESAVKQRELIDRLGRELDAARHVVRPYFRPKE
jgi:SnoaL-like polyketide cyclase.